MNRIYFTLLLLGILLPVSLSAQNEEKVAINQRTPIETLDVNGTLRIRTLPENNAQNAINTQSDKTRATSRNQTFKMKRVLFANAHGVLGWSQELNVPFFTIPSFVLPMKPSDKRVSDNAITVVSNTGTETKFEINLYALYRENYQGTSLVKSPNAVELPLLEMNKLDYFITYHDVDNIDEVEVSDDGVLTYTAKVDEKTMAKTYINITLKPKKQF